MFRRFWTHGPLVLPESTIRTYEDLTTYTKVDSEGNLSVIPDKVTITDLYTEHTTSYLYKDFGAGYFTEDFEIQFEFCVTDDTHGEDTSDMFGIIGVCNTLGIRATWDAGPWVNWRPGTHGIGNINLHAGDDSYATSFIEFPDDPAKIFYCTFKRISSPAPADCGVELSVYSDSLRTILMDKYGGGASIPYGRNDIPSATGLTTFRYLEIAISEQAASANIAYGSYYIQNIEIISN